MKKKKTYILLALILSTGIIIGMILILMQSKESNKLDRVYDLETVKKNCERDIAKAANGKYNNLKLSNVVVDIDDIDELYQIDVEENDDYRNKSMVENFELVKATINKFFGDEFDLSVVDITFFDINEQPLEPMPFVKVDEIILNKKESGSKYFLAFGDARENDGKGFLQIDSNLVSVWFSRGNIQATHPMYSYDVKQVYNLTIDKSEITDVVHLSDGEITIKDAVDFVENYLNNDLPYVKNQEFVYEVAEVRVLDVDGQDALGFCVRKQYKNIPFDYVDAVTSGEFNSIYWDDRGQLCMIKKGEIDNICGLGGDRYNVIKSTDKIEKIISVDGALQAVSKEIGDNSVYDVYGIELIYQFTEDSKDNTLAEYSGRIKWKITSRNQNDDKDTLFYVDVESGKVENRFKPIYSD